MLLHFKVSIVSGYVWQQMLLTSEIKLHAMKSFELRLTDLGFHLTFEFFTNVFTVKQIKIQW